MALEIPLLSGLKVTYVIANNMSKFIKLNLILNLLRVAYARQHSWAFTLYYIYK